MRKIAVAAVVATILALAPAVAHADDFGLGGTIPDDLRHTFCLDFPINDVWDSYLAFFLYWGYHNVMAATDYVEGYDPTCTDETDVVYRIDTTMKQWAGGTACRSHTTGNFCRSALVYINPDNITSTHDLISLSCHEVGHTLGLDDNAQGTDCMSVAYTPSETLNQHHIDHANSRRPYDDPYDR